MLRKNAMAVVGILGAMLAGANAGLWTQTLTYADKKTGSYNGTITFD